MSVESAPSCRHMLWPHAHTVPSLFSARLKNSPAEIAVIPLSPRAWTGPLFQQPLDPLQTSPSPSSPNPLEPLVQTVPSRFSATRLSVRAAICTTSENPSTGLGVGAVVGE